MATLTRGYTFGATETVTNTKLHNLVDNGTLSAILTADISDSQITAAKLATDSVTATKIAVNSVDGTKIALGSDASGDIMYYNGTDYVRLAAGTTNHVLTTGTPPSWVAGSKATLTTQGDILYRDASTLARLAAGTAGKVLRTEGAGANPTWGYPADLTIASQAQGDILYFNGTVWIRLAAGTSGQLLQTNGTGANPSWVTPTAGSSQDRSVTETEVVNTTTETAIYSYSVPGGTLSTNKMLRLFVSADYLNNTGSAHDTTIKVKYGATTIFNWLSNNGSNANRASLRMLVWLSAANATNAQNAQTAITLGPANNGSGGGNTGVNEANGYHATVAEDSTAAKTLQITVQHDSASANLSIKKYVAQLELV